MSTPMPRPGLTLKSFDVILGVDQTGGKLDAHRAKPLPVSLIFHDPARSKWQIHLSPKGPLFLPRFEISDLRGLLQKACGQELEELRILIAVDAVFGLPQIFQTQASACVELKSLFHKAALWPGIGLQAGSLFFNRILEKHPGPSIPRRKIESQLHANSVFTPRPYQRNIQTGTYRIWKELGKQNPHHYQLWPFQAHAPQKGRPLIAEGYPSLAWKYLNSSARTDRQLKELGQKVKFIEPKLKSLRRMSQDHLDATFLACWAWYLLDQGALVPPSSVNLEGDILGSQFVSHLS